MGDPTMHVPGKNAGHIMFYGLSTCGWCAKTKKLLDEMGVDYYLKYVDLLDEGEREKTLEEIRNWNSMASFPTIVIDNQKCIVGYQEDEIRGALKK